MKNYIVTLLTVFVITSCSEEDVKPEVKQDPFIGAWHYVDTYASVDLEISFDVISGKDGEYDVKNIKVKYEDVPEDAVLGMETFDRFADNDGFGRIQIHGGWSFPTHDDWVIITLNYNSIHRQGLPYVMDVDRIAVSMMNRGEPIILENQTFTRID